MPIEVPSLNNPNHVFDIYGESDSDVNCIEDFSKREETRNSKEYDNANMDLEKEGKQADLQELNITRYRHDIDIARKKVKMRKLWSRKKWGWDSLKKTFS